MGLFKQNTKYHLWFPTDSKFDPTFENPECSQKDIQKSLAFTLSRRRKLGIPTEDADAFSDLHMEGMSRFESLFDDNEIIAGGFVFIQLEPSKHKATQCDCLITSKGLYLWATEKSPLGLFKFFTSHKQLLGYKGVDDPPGVIILWNLIQFSPPNQELSLLWDTHVTFLAGASEDGHETRRSWTVLYSLMAIADQEKQKREKGKKKKTN